MKSGYQSGSRQAPLAVAPIPDFSPWSFMAAMHEGWWLMVLAMALPIGAHRHFHPQGPLVVPKPLADDDDRSLFA